MRIIAEIGFNHEGKMDDAAALIRAAADAGADVVKFQTFAATDIVLPSSPHVQAIQAGELDLAQHRTLKELADAAGVEFMSTPFGPRCVDLLEQVGVSEYKIASMDVTNLPLLRLIAATGKPVILSTGMAVLSEIALALETLEANGAGQVSLLHCLSDYPARAEQLNLSVLGLLHETFGVPVGYSDHFPGIDACIAAYFHGAEIIETHFTLDTTIPGGDHAHSADPAMLRRLVDSIALFETMRGDAGTFFRNRPDRANAVPYRRGVHASRPIKAGEVIGEADLMCCRPEQEFGPADTGRLVGLRAGRDIAAHAPVRHDDLKAGKA